MGLSYDERINLNQTFITLSGFKELNRYFTKQGYSNLIRDKTFDQAPWPTFLYSVDTLPAGESGMGLIALVTEWNRISN